MNDTPKSIAAPRMLPERPSLEHLKNEAKARHKLLHAKNPAAQLADTQRDIAREYGFPSWRQLHARVSEDSNSFGPETELEKVNRLRIEQARPRKAIAIDPATIERFVGHYELKRNLVFTVLREDDALILRLTGQPFYVVVPESDHKFFIKNTAIKAQVSFLMKEGNKAAALVLHQNGLEQTAVRISQAQAKAVEDELEERRKRNSPAPGSKAAIHRLVKETQTGNPNYDLMTNGLGQAVREQLADNMRQLQSWGPLVSVEFVGVAQVDGGDVYDVRFASCRTEWRIRMVTLEVVGAASFRQYP
jgi:hypothetical protein